jgi:hypothetical protein
MWLNNTARTTEGARRQLIDAVVVEVLERHFAQRNTHEIGINAPQNSNVADNDNTSLLSFQLYKTDEF